MVMFFEDLADDVLLAVLQETPLASRILRLTLVNRRLHHLVGESLRRTRSLAIVFPRKAKKSCNSSRKLPLPSSSSPDRRLAYFRQNYRLKVLPKSAHLNFCPHHHLTKRSFPANHLLNLFPQLTTLQLVHPPLGDSRHHFHQLIAFLRGLKDHHLRHLSIFFLCTSSKATERAVLGRLEQLIRAAAQSGGSKLLRSLTLTFDLTHQLLHPAVWEFDDEGVGRRRKDISNLKKKSATPPLDLSHLQELTVLFAGEYYFAEDFLISILESIAATISTSTSSSSSTKGLKSFTFNGTYRNTATNQLFSALSNTYQNHSHSLCFLSTPDHFFSPLRPLPLPTSTSSSSGNANFLRELHLQEVARHLPLDSLLLQLALSRGSGSLRRLHLHFTSFRHSVFINGRSSSSEQQLLPQLTGLQTLLLQNSAFLHGGVKGGGDNGGEGDDNLLSAVRRVAQQTPNLKSLLLAGNFSFSGRSPDMRTGAKLSAAEGRISADCPRCRDRILLAAADKDDKDWKWSSTDQRCLQRFKEAVAGSAWAGSLQVVAVQREDSWSLKSCSESVFDELKF